MPPIKTVQQSTENINKTETTTQILTLLQKQRHNTKPPKKLNNKTEPNHHTQQLKERLGENKG